jgi:hypothetical protein
VSNGIPAPDIQIASPLPLGEVQIAAVCLSVVSL